MLQYLQSRPTTPTRSVEPMPSQAATLRTDLIKDRAYTPLSTPLHSAHLTRNQQLQVTTLHDAGHTYKDIAKQLQITQQQVQYAATNPITPRRHSGRPLELTDKDINKLKDFINSSQEARLISYLELSLHLPHLNATKNLIRNALQSRGYRRCLTRQKPPLTKEHRQQRLQFAIKHVN